MYSNSSLKAANQPAAGTITRVDSLLRIYVEAIYVVPCVDTQWYVPAQPQITGGQLTMKPAFPEYYWLGPRFYLVPWPALPCNS